MYPVTNSVNTIIYNTTPDMMLLKTLGSLQSLRDDPLSDTSMVEAKA